MKIKTISDMSYMNYKYYLKQPMKMIEPKLNMIIAKNSQLINSFKRGNDHPLIRKYIYIFHLMINKYMRRMLQMK